MLAGKARYNWWRTCSKSFKEDWTPNFADKRLFTLAPAIAMFGALASFAIIPLSPTLGAADWNIGILFFFAMAGLAVYAVMFGGWASANKFALLGGLRSAAQTISYEVFWAYRSWAWWR